MVYCCRGSPTYHFKCNSFFIVHFSLSIRLVYGGHCANILKLKSDPVSTQFFLFLNTLITYSKTAKRAELNNLNRKNCINLKSIIVIFSIHQNIFVKLTLVFDCCTAALMHWKYRTPHTVSNALNGCGSGNAKV